jgi:predicted glycoside hydrolase/deacetylase ChbG (UPF0249 family)
LAVLAENNYGPGTAVGETSARRRIWLCADDYGISPAVNTAIRDLIVRGRLNATSVMVVAEASHRSEAIALKVLNSGTSRAALASEASGQRGHSLSVRAHSASEDARERADDTRPEPGSSARAAIGLHLTLTAPFRPMSPDYKVPLQDGGFLPLGKTFTKACLHRLSRDTLAAEVSSQLHAFVELFGRTPDFIDGHQHVHLFPQVSEALLDVVNDAAPSAWLRQCGRVLPLAQRFGDRKGLVLDILSYRFRRRAAALGLRTNPAFAGTYDFSERPDFAALFPRFLDGLPDGSLVMCHPGFVDAELERLDPLTTLREQEYAFFAGDAFPALLAARGVALA